MLESTYQCFDIVVMSETLYNKEYYRGLLSLVKHCLKPDLNSFCLIGSKTFYFGLGGGIYELE